MAQDKSWEFPGKQISRGNDVLPPRTVGRGRGWRGNESPREPHRAQPQGVSPPSDDKSPKVPRGRSRGRQRRPDQAIYAPGALRREREQKQVKVTESVSKETGKTCDQNNTGTINGVNDKITTEEQRDNKDICTTGHEEASVKQVADEISSDKGQEDIALPSQGKYSKKVTDELHHTPSIDEQMEIAESKAESINDAAVSEHSDEDEMKAAACSISVSKSDAMPDAEMEESKTCESVDAMAEVSAVSVHRDEDDMKATACSISVTKSDHAMPDAGMEKSKTCERVDTIAEETPVSTISMESFALPSMDAKDNKTVEIKNDKNACPNIADIREHAQVSSCEKNGREIRDEQTFEGKDTQDMEQLTLGRERFSAVPGAEKEVEQSAVTEKPAIVEDELKQSEMIRIYDNASGSDKKTCVDPEKDNQKGPSEERTEENAVSKEESKLKKKSKKKDEKKRTEKDKPDKEEKKRKKEKHKEKSKSEKDRSSKHKSKDSSKKTTLNKAEGSDDDWDANFDESGDCINPDLLEEFSQLTGIDKPKVHKTQFDFYSFKPKETSLEDDPDYAHIIEIYDFSPDLQTNDIAKALSSFTKQGYNIKWVDDTHALAVFSSELTAKQAIHLCSSPLLKLRPVSQGIQESKSKARSCLEFLLPYKERPKTTNLTAHQMVAGALGVKSSLSKEQRQKEREKIKEAREQRRQEKQRKADVWGDDNN